MGIGKGPGRHHLKIAEAFAAYEAVRHRLPDVAPGGVGKGLANLDAIADEVDVFMLDAFGVLNIGEAAIPGVPERVAGLQKAGKRVLVVSNAASHPHAALMQKYRRMGYDFAPEDVITSRKALLHGIWKEPHRRWGLMAPERLGRADLEGLDLIFLGEDPAEYDAVEGFVLLGSAGWTDPHQALLEASLARHPRPVLVGNPDIVAPRESGFSIEPGHFAHRLGDRTGTQLQFFGKPFSNIFELAFARVKGTDRARTVMVGDSLHTDILGGQAAGLKTALIAKHGFFADGDAHAAIEMSGIRPDWILERP